MAHKYNLNVWLLTPNNQIWVYIPKNTGSNGSPMPGDGGEYMYIGPAPKPN
jgi:hypothetical protein